MTTKPTLAWRIRVVTHDDFYGLRSNDTDKINKCFTIVNNLTYPVRLYFLRARGHQCSFMTEELDTLACQNVETKLFIMATPCAGDTIFLGHTIRIIWMDMLDSISFWLGSNCKRMGKLIWVTTYIYTYQSMAILTYGYVMLQKREWH